MQNRLSLSLLAIAIATSSLMPPAFSADRVVLKYSAFRRSLSVKELTTFAETGKLSSSLRRNFQTIGQDPDETRELLNAPISVDVVFLDNVLHSPIGTKVLDRVAEIIHTPSSGADRQALRGALLISASDDGTMTLLEIMQNYPTQDVEVEGARLIEAYTQLSRFTEPAGLLLDLFK